MARAEALQVEVVYCPGPGRVDAVWLRLPPGSSATDAVLLSGLAQRHALPSEGLRLGLWCKPCSPDTLLRERDRVEIYRPLIVDPKEARRQRYRQHLEKSEKNEKKA